MRRPEFSTATKGCAALALALTLSCGGSAPAKSAANSPAPASQGKAAAGPAFDLEGMLAKEATGLKDHAVSGPGQAWSAKVPSVGEATLTLAGEVVLVEIPVGSDAAIRCQVHPEQVDAAGTMYGVIKESAARVEYRQVAPAGVKLIGDSPAAFLEALYVTDVPGGKAAGGLKLAIHAREGRSLFCLHDELGYRETFQRVSSAFFASFQEAKKPESKATYSEVSVVKLDDMAVGFNVTRMSPGAKPGERERADSSSSFIPTSATDMIFEDSFNITRYNAKGQIAEDTFIEASQGELNLQLKLSRADDGKYSYAGTISGKKVSGALATPKGLTTSLQTAVTLRKKLKAGGAFQDVVDEYHPNIDPTAVLPVTYAHAKDAPPRQITVKLGDRVITSEVDDDGMRKSGGFDLGKHKLTFERLRVDGHP
jgi:hypothetical protein